MKNKKKIIWFTVFPILILWGTYEYYLYGAMNNVIKNCQEINFKEKKKEDSYETCECVSSLLRYRFGSTKLIIASKDWKSWFQSLSSQERQDNINIFNQCQAAYLLQKQKN